MFPFTHRGFGIPGFLLMPCLCRFIYLIPPQTARAQDDYLFLEPRLANDETILDELPCQAEHQESALSMFPGSNGYIIYLKHPNLVKRKNLLNIVILTVGSFFDPMTSKVWLYLLLLLVDLVFSYLPFRHLFLPSFRAQPDVEAGVGHRQLIGLVGVHPEESTSQFQSGS